LVRLWVLLLRRGWAFREPSFDDLEIFRRESVEVAASDEDCPQSFFGGAGNLIAIGEDEPASANIG
jgi:hypothetical protein